VSSIELNGRFRTEKGGKYYAANMRGFFPPKVTEAQQNEISSSYFVFIICFFCYGN
jgi:hypothetical protein